MALPANEEYACKAAAKKWLYAVSSQVMAWLANAPFTRNMVLPCYALHRGYRLRHLSIEKDSIINNEFRKPSIACSIGFLRVSDNLRDCTTSDWCTSLSSARRQ
jgi:hypothetical protein